MRENDREAIKNQQLTVLSFAQKGLIQRHTVNILKMRSHHLRRNATANGRDKGVVVTGSPAELGEKRQRDGFHTTIDTHA
jgi:hypothetical protein